MAGTSSEKATQLNTSQRKRSSDQPKAIFRKIRAVSGFNLWHSHYMQSNESQQFSSLAEKNKQSAQKWWSLADEERSKYYAEAAAQSCGEVVFDSKKEADKIIRHLADTGEHADKLKDFHLIYVVVHNGKHYVGGSTSGCNFLRDQDTHIPYSFIGHLSAQSAPQPVADETCTSDDKNTLRKVVTKIFNDCYVQCVNKPGARLPYSKIKEDGIRMDGLPDQMILKNPAAYGKTTLQQIIANKDALKLHVRKTHCVQEPAACSSDST